MTIITNLVISNGQFIVKSTRECLYVKNQVCSPRIYFSTAHLILLKMHTYGKHPMHIVSLTCNKVQLSCTSRVKNQSFTFQPCCNKAGRCKIEILYIDTIIILNNNHNNKQKLLYDLKKYKITYCERKSCKIIIHMVYYFIFILVIKWLDNHLVVINLLGMVIERSKWMIEVTLWKLMALKGLWK